MPKDTKTLCIKKGCASVLTQPLHFLFALNRFIDRILYLFANFQTA